MVGWVVGGSRKGWVGVKAIGGLVGWVQGQLGG